MKGLLSIYLLMMLLIPYQANAQRGELIAHELMVEWEGEDIAEYISEFMIVSNELDEIPIVADLLEWFVGEFISWFIDNRSLEIYKVIYETVDWNDEITQASGVVMIPTHEAYTCVNSISLYGHGTKFGREEVFSRPESWDPFDRGLEFLFPLLMSSVNTICVVPDYYGLGDGPGFHHHNLFKTNATSSIDIVRAGRNLCDLLGVEYNDRFLPFGYSEGGTNAMGTAKMIFEQGLEEEFNIPTVYCGSGAYDLSVEAFDFIFNDPYYPTRDYIMYLLASCADIYGDLVDEAAGETYSTYIIPPYDSLFEEHILTQDGILGWSTVPWTDMFYQFALDDIGVNTDHPFRQCLEANNVYDWPNPNETYMYYCRNDEQVPWRGAIKARNVQRSYIPWWNFWDRFKIQALDLTIDYSGIAGADTVSAHDMCGITTVLLQNLMLQNNLGLSCEENREGQLTRSTLKTAGGESLKNRIIYADKQIDLTVSGSDGKKRNSIQMIHVNSASFFDGGHRSKLNLNENGLYILLEEFETGQREFSYVYRSAPDFVSTLDYNPIRTDPLIDRTTLDLALLQEDVMQVAVLDLQGNEYLRLQGPFDQSVDIERTNQMIVGDYVVEVRTDRATYPLKISVADLQEEEGLVFENPVNGLLDIRSKECSFNLENISVKVYNLLGERVNVSLVSASHCHMEIRTDQLSTGFHIMELMHGDHPERIEFIRR